MKRSIREIVNKGSEKKRHGLHGFSLNINFEICV